MDLTPEKIIDRYTLGDLAAYVSLSELALACCAEEGISTMAALRKALQEGNDFRERTQCGREVEAELMALLSPPGLPADWPPLPDPEDRLRQYYAHLPSLCRTALTKWLRAYENEVRALQYLVHTTDELAGIRGFGPAVVEGLNAWRAEMRTRIPAPAQPLERSMLQLKVKQRS